jgi:TaqI-like C-terminal specificity domain
LAARPRNWQNKSFYETPKIAVRETGARIIATLDNENRYFLSSLYAVYPKPSASELDLRYLLAIINSKFATWYVRLIAFGLTEGAFTKIRTNQFGRLPINIVAHSEPVRRRIYDRLVTSVDKILALTPSTRTAKTDAERTALQNAIRKTDRDIDHLVYQLYGLTPEEIALVEGTAETVAET